MTLKNCSLVRLRTLIISLGILLSSITLGQDHDRILLDHVKSEFIDSLKNEGMHSIIALSGQSWLGAELRHECSVMYYFVTWQDESQGSVYYGILLNREPHKIVNHIRASPGLGGGLHEVHDYMVKNWSGLKENYFWPTDSTPFIHIVRESFRSDRVLNGQYYHDTLYSIGDTLEISRDQKHIGGVTYMELYLEGEHIHRSWPSNYTFYRDNGVDLLEERENWYEENLSSALYGLYNAIMSQYYRYGYYLRLEEIPCDESKTSDPRSAN